MLPADLLSFRRGRGLHLSCPVASGWSHRVLKDHHETRIIVLLAEQTVDFFIDDDGEVCAYARPSTLSATKKFVPLSYVRLKCIRVGIGLQRKPVSVNRLNLGWELKVVIP